MISQILLAASLLSSPATAQFGPIVDGYIIFKDGYSIHGRLVTDKKFEIDPASGTAYVIPNLNGFTTIDDEVCRIYFPPGQIADTVRLKPGELTKEQILFTRNDVGVSGKPALLVTWRFETLPPFDKSWERTLKVLTAVGGFPMHQRITQLSPQRMRIRSKTHAWDMNFRTKELGDDELAKLLTDYFETSNDMKKYAQEEKDFIRALFYQQMGRLDDAERMARGVLEKVPERKKKIDEFFELIGRERAKKFASEFEALANAKQNRTLVERIATYERDGLAEKVPEKIRLLVQELKNKYETDEERLAKARVAFDYLMSKRPEPRGFWLEASTTILKELNADTLPKLETFVTFADQYKRNVDQGMSPNLKVEQVLSLAVTGWHLGNISSEPDVTLAKKLWTGRGFVREFMKADTAGQRSTLVDAWVKETYLPIDVVARLLQNLPPPNALEKLEPGIMTLDYDLPDAAAGTYLVQLPPDYHHLRAHPLLVLAHSSREEADVLMQRWAPLAARHGFILAAPLWTKQSPNGFRCTDVEQEYFMNCLKDVKRRFQIDTDRVFLYGWAGGGNAAWDVGFAHPDQFAGVLPMCGLPSEFVKGCWSNAQNLGLYIVDGEKSGNGPPLTRGLFKEFIRNNFNAYYLEYKGRANELYIGEFESMMDWMSRKKRVYPTRQLGTYATIAGSSAEEFRTFRQSDNRFYWLGTDEIDDKHLQDHEKWVKYRKPAMLQATITVTNEGDAKGKARIVSNIAVRSQGIKQCTVWLSPSMIDFSQPVQLRHNGKVLGVPRVVTPRVATMLEEYFMNVDRQRLYYARLDFKI